MRFLIKSDTNQAVQPQKMTICLKFWIKEVQGFYYPCSKNEGTDQLHGYTMQLICTFVFTNSKIKFS